MSKTALPECVSLFASLIQFVISKCGCTSEHLYSLQMFRTHVLQTNYWCAQNTMSGMRNKLMAAEVWEWRANNTCKQQKKKSSMLATTAKVNTLTRSTPQWKHLHSTSHKRPFIKRKQLMPQRLAKPQRLSEPGPALSTKDESGFQRDESLNILRAEAA